MYTIAWSIAQIAGPTGGSFIADKYSFTTLCWVLAVICLITSTGFFLLGTQINRNENKIAA